MRTRMPDGAGGIACPVERLHVEQRNTRVVRLLIRQLVEPARRTAVIAGGAALFGQVFNCLGVALIEPVSLGVHPPLEFGGRGHVESIEKWPSAERRRRGQVPAFERSIELAD